MNTDPAPLLSFGIFTDAHYTPPDGEGPRGDSPAKFRSCIDLFNARKLPLAIFLGDLIESDRDRPTSLACAREMGEAFAEFHGERHFVLGNHDLLTLTKCEFLQAAGAGDGPGFYSFDCRGAHLAVLDGNCHQDGADFAEGDFNWERAWVSEAQLTQLTDDLAAAGDRPTIVLCHEDLDDRRDDQGELSILIVRNAPAVRAVLAGSHNVVAVITAHHHAGFETVIDGIPHFVLKSLLDGPLDEGTCGIVSIWPDGGITVEGFGHQGDVRFAPRPEAGAGLPRRSREAKTGGAPE